ncbi:MAG: lipopolysaccharide heptosyltransferase family protein, partial [Bacteroidota bacterium]|nr:lipopolysaccharide heptosyltransferase family protein [Bacteroidota bacterium]
MPNTGIWKKVNAARKALMHRITRNLGTTHVSDDPTIASRDSIKRILVCRPNHRLGNLLLITPLLQEIIATLPHAKIDLFVKGKTAPELFKHYPNIDRLIMLPKKPARNIVQYMAGWMRIKMTQYDIAINVVNDSSSGRLSVQFANARYKFLGDLSDELISDLNDRPHIAKRPVYSFRSNIGKLGFKPVSSPVPSLDLRLTVNEIEKGKKVLDALVINEKRSIGIYTY